MLLLRDAMENTIFFPEKMKPQKFVLLSEMLSFDLNVTSLEENFKKLLTFDSVSAQIPVKLWFNQILRQYFLHRLI